MSKNKVQLVWFVENRENIKDPDFLKDLIYHAEIEKLMIVVEDRNTFRVSSTRSFGYEFLEIVRRNGYHLAGLQMTSFCGSSTMTGEFRR